MPTAQTLSVMARSKARLELHCDLMTRSPASCKVGPLTPLYHKRSRATTNQPTIPWRARPLQRRPPALADRDRARAAGAAAATRRTGTAISRASLRATLSPVRHLSRRVYVISYRAAPRVAYEGRNDEWRRQHEDTPSERRSAPAVFAEGAVWQEQGNGRGLSGYGGRERVALSIKDREHTGAQLPHSPVRSRGSSQANNAKSKAILHPRDVLKSKSKDDSTGSDSRSRSQTIRPSPSQMAALSSASTVVKTYGSLSCVAESPEQRRRTKSASPHLNASTSSLHKYTESDDEDYSDLVDKTGGISLNGALSV